MRGSRLRVESGESIRLRGHRGREHFERDLALQIGIDGPIDLAHAAGPDPCVYLIPAELGASSKSHSKL